MTEVYISALSSIRIDLNEEDREFFQDEKKKEISEVRYCLDYLCEFNSYSPKDRMQIDLPFVWKSINFLAKILGFENEFTSISKLHLPETILLQDLFFVRDLFSHRAYRSLQVIDRWDSESAKYIVLLSGMIEKESFRTSIFETSYDSLTHKSQGGVMCKSKKNGKKRFGRTEDQIPICVNSKRNQQRALDQSSGLYRSVTSSQTFEVNLSAWKRYVSTFKKMEEHYIQNFIRKALDINFNPDPLLDKVRPQTEQKEGEEQNSLTTFYTIQDFQRKQEIELDNRSVFLLYLGEMMLVTPHYKIQTSRGCVLNSQISECLNGSNNERSILGSAKAKTESTIIKLNLNKMLMYLQYYSEDRKSLTSYLSNLEKNRREKLEIIGSLKKEDMSFNKASVFKDISQSSLHNNLQARDTRKIAQQIRNSVAKMFNVTPKRTTFLPNCKGAKTNTESSEIVKSLPKKNLLEFNQIEKRIEKQEKIAQLIKNEYSKKFRQTEPAVIENIRPLTRAELEEYESYSILNSVLLKDSMLCIHARNDLLKKTVLEHRRKRQEEGVFQDKSLLSPSKFQIRTKRDTSSEVIRRKIKEIYLKTEEDQNEGFSFSENFSQRNRMNEFQRKDFQPRVTGEHSIQGSLSNQNLWMNYGEYMPKGRGVMKRLQRGQIRRMKLR